MVSEGAEPTPAWIWITRRPRNVPRGAKPTTHNGGKGDSEGSSKIVGRVARGVGGVDLVEETMRRELSLLRKLCQFPREGEGSAFRLPRVQVCLDDFPSCSIRAYHPVRALAKLVTSGKESGEVGIRALRPVITETVINRRDSSWHTPPFRSTFILLEDTFHIGGGGGVLWGRGIRAVFARFVFGRAASWNGE